MADNAARGAYVPGTITEQVALAKEQAAIAKGKALAALAALAQETDVYTQRIEEARQQYIGQAANSASGPDTLREQRAWDRIQSVLARCASDHERSLRLQQFIAEAGKQGDLATLRALRTELPSYLEAREPDALREQRQRAGKAFAEGNDAAQRLLAAVHTARVPHLPAEERAAYELAEAVKPAAWAVKPNFDWARGELDGGNRVSLLYGWEQKSTIPVELPAAVAPQ